MILEFVIFTKVSNLVMHLYWAILQKGAREKGAQEKGAWKKGAPKIGAQKKGAPYKKRRSY